MRERDVFIDLRIGLPLSLASLDAIEAELIERDPALHYRTIEWPERSPEMFNDTPSQLDCAGP